MSKEAMKLALEEMKVGNYNSAAERLEMALAEQPAIFNGWQPAGTAPKDARILFLPKMFGNQKEQEPVNICWWSDKHKGWRSDLCEYFGGTEDFDFWMPLPPIQQPAQQEPVAWMTKDGEIYKHECWPEYEARPLVFGDTSPQPAQRKPLMDEQMDAAVKAWFEKKTVPGRRPFAVRMRAAIEAANQRRK